MISILLLPEYRVPDALEKDGKVLFSNLKFLE